jgi:glycosyltransferase involved in cell wall biosynthesis
LQLKNVRFTGHLENISDIWKEHHALVLPSRSEGLPLVVLEAMAAGRPVIATTAGGSRELVTEGITGFIGEAGQESFEQAMERAWQERDRWKTMGEAAYDHIINQVPKSPETDFANCLINFLV